MIKFIETEDKKVTKYKINVRDIAVIEDSDKYFCTIRLPIVDNFGHGVSINSIHSYEELNNLINED